jgi:hypothetical protein
MKVEAEFSRNESLAHSALPNTACSGFAGVCGIFKQFSGFEFFLLPNRVPVRPSASKADR